MNNEWSKVGEEFAKLPPEYTDVLSEYNASSEEYQDNNRNLRIKEESNKKLLHKMIYLVAAAFCVLFLFHIGRKSDIPEDQNPIIQETLHDENGNVVGKIYDAIDTEQVIVDAYIEVYKNDEYVGCTFTDENGSYLISLDPGMYTFEIIKDDYRQLRVYVEIEDTEVKHMENLFLVKDDGAEVYISGTIIDAMTGLGVPYGYIEIRQHLNNTDGELMTETGSLDDGLYEIVLPAGYYTFTVQKEGYISTSINVVACGESLNEQNCTIMPFKDESVYTVVLTWGENPIDLDTHVVGPYDEIQLFHVYYQNYYYDENGTIICMLDVDDTTSYGPETISITPSSDKPYYYFVHHYEGEGTIATSNAKVVLYKGNEIIQTFNAPNASSSGLIWNVFAIRGDEIVVNNTYSEMEDVHYAD